MQTEKEITFQPTQNEYVLKLKQRRFPWWILLIPFLFLFLLIKITDTLEFKVVEDSTKTAIKDAKVVLSYTEKSNNENRSISATTSADGLVKFTIGENRLYEVILGKQTENRSKPFNVLASKEGYSPDSLMNLTFKLASDNSDRRLLKLKLPAPPPIVKKHDSIPQKPREGCRAFFTGLVVGGEFQDGDISEIYKLDNYSEYVGEGDYPDNTKAFPKSVATTFDGIAIDKGTQVIIYSKKNFKGKILLDKTGPAVINNVLWKNDSRYSHCNTDTYKEPLQSNFPQSVREWSETNMQEWSYGSLKVICK